MEVLFLILILSTGTLLGNEFSVGAFIHPALSRDGDERFLPAIQVFARLFKRDAGSEDHAKAQCGYRAFAGENR